MPAGYWRDRLGTLLGVGYYEKFSTLDNWPSTRMDVTIYQSYLDIITSATKGFGYRADESRNTFARLN